MPDAPPVVAGTPWTLKTCGIFRIFYLDLPDCFQYDGMHTIGGIIKGVFSMMLGYLPTPTAAVWAYDAIVNKSRASHYVHCELSECGWYFNS